MHLVLGNPLQPLINVFEQVLLFFHNTIGVSWGLSIILMTFVIRAALIPLTLKQFRSMQELQRHQPEMKKLQEKYKGDKARLNQEMMKFYQEHKINPLASCLPLVAQMPVFISLFYMLRHDLRNDICGQVAHPCGEAARFLFIPDLTDKTTGTVLIVLMILYVGTQLVSSLLMTVTADKTQRNLMLFLPLIFLAFIYTFPAGLIVYWITTNVWTIVQQQIVKRRVGPMRPAEPAVAVAGAGSAGDGGGGGGGLLARLRPPTPPAPAASSDGGGNGASKRPSSGNGRAATASPPPPPRKKKKRSGRRR
jgi:YidC/Oxa1 family membrane protein insertase